MQAWPPLSPPATPGAGLGVPCRRQWLIEMGADALPAERADALGAPVVPDAGAARTLRRCPGPLAQVGGPCRAACWPCVRAEVPFFSLGCEDEDIARYGAYAEGAIDALATNPADSSRAGHRLQDGRHAGRDAGTGCGRSTPCRRASTRMFLHKAGFEAVTVKFVRVEQANPAIFVEPAEPQVVTYNL